LERLDFILVVEEETTQAGFFVSPAKFYISPFLSARCRRSSLNLAEFNLIYDFFTKEEKPRAKYYIIPASEVVYALEENFRQPEKWIGSRKISVSINLYGCYDTHDPRPVKGITPFGAFAFLSQHRGVAGMATISDPFIRSQKQSPTNTNHQPCLYMAHVSNGI
jgi:hypothetical protein